MISTEFGANCKYCYFLNLFSYKYANPFQKTRSFFSPCRMCIAYQYSLADAFAKVSIAYPPADVSILYSHVEMVALSPHGMA